MWTKTNGEFYRFVIQVGQTESSETNYKALLSWLNSELNMQLPVLRLSGADLLALPLHKQFDENQGDCFFYVEKLCEKPKYYNERFL